MCLILANRIRERISQPLFEPCQTAVNQRLVTNSFAQQNFGDQLVVIDELLPPLVLRTPVLPTAVPAFGFVTS